MLYQLSYSRLNGQGRIRTSEGLPQRVYSPLHLATLVPTHVFNIVFYFAASERNRTPDPLITNQLLYRLSYAGIIYQKISFTPYFYYKGLKREEIGIRMVSVDVIFPIYSGSSSSFFEKKSANRLT